MPSERTIDGLREILFKAAERLESAAPEAIDGEPIAGQGDW